MQEQPRAVCAVLCAVLCLGVVQFPGGQPRTLEDLKDRYYSIARKLMVAREGTDSTLLNQLLLRQPYNANQGATDNLCAVAGENAASCASATGVEHGLGCRQASMWLFHLLAMFWGAKGVNMHAFLLSM
jgi:hypothetical protein